jgi:hypothetical protein
MQFCLTCSLISKNINLKRLKTRRQEHLDPREIQCGTDKLYSEDIYILYFFLLETFFFGVATRFEP